MRFRSIVFYCVVAASLAATWTTILELGANLLVPEFPVPSGVTVLAATAFSLWAILFVSAFALGLGLAVVGSRPWTWITQRALREGMFQKGFLYRFSLVFSLVAGSVLGLLLLATLKNANTGNILITLGVAGVASIGIFILVPIFARFLLSASTRNRPGTLERLVVFGMFLTAFLASRFLMRFDYTTVHQLLSIVSLVSAILMAIPMTMRLSSAPKAGVVVSLGCPLLLATGLFCHASSNEVRFITYNRTGVSGYFIVTARQAYGAMKSTPPSPAANSRGLAPKPDSPGPKEAPSNPVHIIWVLIDTLRADRLGAYNPDSTLTPNLDAFAREACVFENAYAQAVHTMPSYISFFTGRYPALVDGNTYNMWRRKNPAKAPLFLPEPWTGVTNNPGVFRYALKDHLQKESFLFLPTDQKRGDDSRNEAIIDFISNMDIQKPTFLWLPYFGPHAEPPMERAFLYTPYFMMKQRFRTRYDELVQASDRRFGDLVKALKARGIYDNSLMIVFSDHGEELGGHGGFFHSKQIYNSVNHVPLMMRFPGGQNAKRLRMIVELIDLMPTTCDFAGVTPRTGTPPTGRSLLPYIRGETPVSGIQRAMTQSVYVRRKMASVVEKDADGHTWKGIWDETNSAMELYDMDGDPGETENMADRMPDKANRLREVIRRWVRGQSLGQFVPVIQ